MIWTLISAVFCYKLSQESLADQAGLVFDSVLLSMKADRSDVPRTLADVSALRRPKVVDLRNRSILT
jgi:hypothetical protein